MKLNTLQDLLVHGVQDLYSAEQQLVEALPQMIAAASSDELRTALQEHLEQTRGHVSRLEDLLPMVGAGGAAEKCEGMEGLLREGQKVIKGQGDPMVKDAALIAAAQKVEHYEIAGYGTVAALADILDLDDAKDTLGQILDEEETADKLLTKIATGGMFRVGGNERAPS
jgi:ferritin-like metal-binding protein YciE